MVYHEPALGLVSDVSDYDSIWSDRIKTKSVVEATHGNTNIYTNDYFIDEFTLKEVKKLRLKQRY